jgi:hypothetical protein
MYVCMYVFTYVCMYVYTYVCIIRIYMLRLRLRHRQRRAGGQTHTRPGGVILDRNLHFRTLAKGQDTTFAHTLAVGPGSYVRNRRAMGAYMQSAAVKCAPHR